ncbi:MAG: PTS sugar transporter subunit IIA [Gemmatimonadaceae bacterium]|nr:PTS sugar transporter subunit IIA [Gemmatimonadaceae bacterium]
MSASASLCELLRAGGIYHDVAGTSKRNVLRELVMRLPMLDESGRRVVFQELMAREALGTTAIGGGIAIPHLRNRTLLTVAEPSVTLCLLRDGVDFGALDQLAVHALFLVLSPSPTVHLRVLARVGVALRDDALGRLLAAGADCDALLKRIALIEKTRAR